MKKRKTSERKEGWMRIVVGVVSGIILCVWSYLVVVLGVVNWLIVVFSGKRNKGIAEFNEVWNTQYYTFVRYMIFVTNERPFPFVPLKANISRFS